MHIRIIQQLNLSTKHQ